MYMILKPVECSECHAIDNVEYVTRRNFNSTEHITRCRSCGHEKVTSTTTSNSNCGSTSFTYRADTSPIKLKYQNPIDIKECFLELFDTHLRYKLRFKAEEPTLQDDESSGLTERITDFDSVILKSVIASIERNRTDDGTYIVIINSPQNAVKIYYNKHTEAFELYEKLLIWLLSQLFYYSLVPCVYFFLFNSTH